MIEDNLILTKIKAISDYQFGPDITDALFTKDTDVRVIFSRNTGKIKHIFDGEKLLLNFRPNNGLFTLTFHSGQRIIANTVKPRLRVVVLNDVAEFIKKGRNVFCKHVIDIDRDLRPMDEVLIVDENDDLLAIGRLNLPIDFILAFDRGLAINVRKGINKSKI